MPTKPQKQSDDVDRERDEKIAAMQRLVTEGLESGTPEEFDFDDFLRNPGRRCPTL